MLPTLHCVLCINKLTDPWICQLCSSFFLPVLYMPWAQGTGVLACLVLFCTLICLERATCSPTEEGSSMGSELFFFQMQSSLAQVFQEGERTQGVFSDLHTPGTVWFAIGRTVCASSGTCLPTLQWLHSCLSFLYMVFFGQSFSCRWNHFLCQEYSTCVTEDDFFVYL